MADKPAPRPALKKELNGREVVLAWVSQEGLVPQALAHAGDTGPGFFIDSLVDMTEAELACLERGEDPWNDPAQAELRTELAAVRLELKHRTASRDRAEAESQRRRDGLDIAERQLGELRRELASARGLRDLRFDGKMLSVPLWYPRTEDPERTPDHPVSVELKLIAARAARSIRVHYDFVRNGYVVTVSQLPPGHTDDHDCDLVWVEAAFVEGDLDHG